MQRIENAAGGAEITGAAPLRRNERFPLRQHGGEPVSGTDWRTGDNASTVRADVSNDRVVVRGEPVRDTVVHDLIRHGVPAELQRQVARA